MSYPTAPTLNRAIAASWHYFGLMIFGACIPLLAQEFSPVTTLLLDSPETKGGVHSSHSIVFAGHPRRFEWGFRSQTEQTGKLRLSLYRVLSSTVVPIEEEVILDPELHLRPGQISVADYQFDVPDSFSEVRYLAKLWFEFKGKATLVGTQTILAIPKNLLSQHRGVKLLLCGFGREEGSLEKLFESFSWEVTTAETIPETIAANIIITAPSSEAPSGSNGTTLIYLDLSLIGDPSPRPVSVSGSGEVGKVTRYEIPAGQWAALPTSAASQHLLATIIAELLKTP